MKKKLQIALLAERFNYARLMFRKDNNYLLLLIVPVTFFMYQFANYVLNNWNLIFPKY